MKKFSNAETSGEFVKVCINFSPVDTSGAGIFFCSCPSFLDEPCEETLATQAKSSGEELSFVTSEGEVRKVNYR